jgi:hypothetical protein
MSGMLNPLVFVPGIPMFVLLIGLVYTNRLRAQAVEVRAEREWMLRGWRAGEHA